MSIFIFTSLETHFESHLNLYEYMSFIYIMYDLTSYYFPSAGVGRTGTFIGLDNMVNQARKEGCIRPLQIVKSLRSQRVNMVQTKVRTNNFYF